MKHSLMVIACLAMVLCAARAASLSEMASDPAQVRGVGMQASPLVVSPGDKGWAEIPPQLTAHHAMILRPLKDQLGHAVLTVTKSGYLLLACNYARQGNASGDWKKSVWTERDFKKREWGVADKKALGGELVQGDGRVQVIFYKKVRKGEVLDLRCNKYDPPYPILLR